MRRVRTDQEGFTLIELLVVIGIIGILAAISLPAFLGQTNGASDAKAKTEISTAAKAIESFWAERDTYAATVADLVAFDQTLDEAINLAITGTATTYVITTESKRGATYQLEKTALTGVTRSCAPAGTGGCSDSGGW
jgi:type IV pilus assembly protein PilA